MKTSKLAAAIAATLIATIPLSRAQPAEPEESGPRVQLALLLDTSSSMSGLIDQARSQIWQVVNTFINAKQDGQTPIVEVALYEYGNSQLDAETHFIRQLQPLTRDLDAVSESLFALTTSGGEEFCGAVIQQATADLDWDPSPDTYKAIFIAGNEPFTQGPISPEQSCKEAITKAIIVNTIHCGGESEGADSGWKSGALLADGRYLVIDHNQAVIAIDAPQDAEIAQLNEALNETYIAYGKDGAAMQSRQAGQDVRARAAAPAVQSQRAATKASGNYINTAWDLVDAVREEAVKLEDISKEELPAELQEVPTEKLAEVVAGKARERSEIQEKILSLNADREAFVAQERQKLAGETDTLDSAIISAAREQAVKKGIVFGSN